MDWCGKIIAAADRVPVGVSGRCGSQDDQAEGKISAQRRRSAHPPIEADYQVTLIIEQFSPLPMPIKAT